MARLRPPYGPATIGAILPGPELAGTVELKVVGHEGREFDAENVDQIVFDYDVDPHPHLHIMGFNIHGTLGPDPNTDNHVFGIDGDFSAASVAAPFYVFGGVTGNVTITGDVRETRVTRLARPDSGENSLARALQRGTLYLEATPFPGRRQEEKSHDARKSQDLARDGRGDGRPNYRCYGSIGGSILGRI
jgi:hypothetical protein